MAQVATSNYPIPNDTGANVRSDINDNLEDLYSTSSGSSAPPAAIDNQLWIDTSTTPDTLKCKQGNSWISLGTISTNLGLAPAASPSFTGNLNLPAGSSSSLPLRVTGDTDTGLFFATNAVNIHAGGTTAHEFTASGSSPKVPVRATNGSDSAPSYSFSSDTNTGIYRQAADQIGFATDGTTRATINSVGLVVRSGQGIQFNDSDNSHWARLKAPGTISTDFTLTLPDHNGAINNVLVSNGDGALSWTSVSAIYSAPSVTGGFTAYAILKHVENSGTDAGGSGTSWTDRVINQETTDPSNIVTISSNSFTLGAGNYLIKAEATSEDIQSTRLRLYDTTNSATRITGRNGYGVTFGDHNRWDSLIGRVTPSASTTYKLQMISDMARSGHGHGASQSLGGDEIYVQIEIYKER
jgi:hypothetical protein